MAQRTRLGFAAMATLCVVMLLAASTPARGQGAGSATLRGAITDASGGALPWADVTVVNQRTKLTRSASADARGEYVLVALPPDTYRVQVTLQGFALWKSGEIHLSPGDSLHLATRLTVGERTEEVTVEAERALIRTDTGAREGRITADQIQSLSIVGRSAMELLRILPGVVNDSDQKSYETVGQANDYTGTSVNGTRGTTISPVLDGSKLIDPGSNSGLIVNLNPDMVDEVKVQTSNYAAEYGSASVQITATTKGGSSSFHGSVYDYWRNWRFAANDRSNNYARVREPKSDYQYPGFNLSGPVLVPGTDFNKNRDKLFFFMGFEYQHQIIDPGTTRAVVPTLKQRQGDFSELLSNRGQNLSQPPLVTIPGGFPGEGEPAPNNDLHPYIDPYGRAILSMYPQPNFDDPNNRYNYAFNTAEPRNRWQLVSRLDWNASARTHAYVRLALEREKDEWARGVWGGWSSFELPSPVQGDRKSWSLSINATSVLSPSLTNEVLLSGIQLKLDNDWKDPSRMTLSAWGLDGFRGPFDNKLSEASVQVYSDQGLGNFAPTSGLPVYAHHGSLSFADNLTKVASAHTIKFGVFVERGQTQQNFDAQPQGQFILGSAWTPGGTGDDYGDLLVGRMAQFYQSTPVPRGEWRFWNLEGYLQDSWKARRNLTVEAGLRVAKLTNNEELNRLGVLFDPSAYEPRNGAFIDGDPQRPNGVLLAKRGEIPKGMTASPGPALMPRLNLAWDARGDGDLVLRGGAGLFYNRPMGNYQYFIQATVPNTFNTIASWWDIQPGGLTISDLPRLDPYSRPATSWLQSIDSRSVHLPRTWNWSFGVVKRLPWRQTLDVAYVGNRTDHLPDTTIANYIVPGSLKGLVGNADLDNPLHRVALDESVAATFRKYPAYSPGGALYQYEAASRYHGLQATLSRQGTRVQYFVNYTFSKVLGTTGNTDYATIDAIDARNRSYGIPFWDRTHVFNASYNVALPDPISGKGNGALRAVLNGWQVSGITSYRSGTPFHVVFTGALAEAQIQRAWWGTDAHQSGWAWGESGSVTPVFLGNPQLGNNSVGEKILDINMIGIPAFRESGPFQSPYYLRFPSRWNFDVTLFKTLPLQGAKRLQFRLGVFNLFNQATPAWGAGDVDLDLRTECNVKVDGVPNGAGGTVDGVCDPTRGFHFTELTKQNFGKIVSKRGHRVIEVAARFDF